MKKTLFAILATVAMVACSNDEVVRQAAPEAIEFDGVFVDNSTRAAYDGSYTVNTLESFEVYGTVKGTGTDEGTGNIFNGELVEKQDGGAWTYDSANTQYWVPGNNYKFRAIVDGNVANVTEVVALEADKYMASAINLLDASAQKDILTAECVYTNYAKPAEGTQPVAFTFKHILSKAKFTFKNTVTTNNGYSYKVTNVRIVDAVKNGVYTITNGTTGTWVAATTPANYILSFGNVVETGTEAGAEAANLGYNGSLESNYDRLLIPGVNTAVNVKFNYQLLKDGAVIDTQEDVTTSATVTLESGHAYNFVVSLGNPGDPITFKLETITNWDTTNGDKNF